MKKTILFFSIFLIFNGLSFAQKKLLQSGPMVGYSTMREVLLWVQTTQAARVKFVYYEKGKPTEKMTTIEVITDPQQAFVARCTAVVVPNQKYSYELWINNKKIELPYPLEFQSQTLWQWRSDPPDFRFVFGTCAYVNEPAYDRPGKPYGDNYEIFGTILQKKPDFMLWGGDNVYLREVDFDSRTGILHRYTHGRSLPELQPLLGSVHHYAIWDDHDYGADNSNASFPYKEQTLEAFKLFWGNPNVGILGENVGGITGHFSWSDADFFLLDNRWFKIFEGNKTLKTSMLGEKQIAWLVEALRYSKATFKFIVVGGQVLNNADVSQNSSVENHSEYPEERNFVLQAIQNEGIKGVIFLTGDRHFTELSKLEKGVKLPIYDLTVSPLTSGASGDKALNEGNTLRVPNTYVGERNFATLDFSGTKKDRKLLITVYNTKGEKLWEQKIEAAEWEK